MWTRKELKTRGKKAFLLNYWKTVLVSFILLVLVSGVAGSVSGVGGGRSGKNEIQTSIESNDAQSEVGTALEQAQLSMGFDIPKEAAPILAVAGGLVGIVIIAVVLAVSAFLINPIEVGCKRFFLKNLNQKASVSEITYAFDNNYLNIVKTTLLRDIYTLLWGLLFIIPGIIKSYEYRLIPYLLADNPEMTKDEAFARSKELMKGQKWRTFVLDLSFLGWDILSLFTARILEMLYVGPYKNMTEAALYERLVYGNLSEEAGN